MPLYPFRCRACGHRDEELARVAERDEARTCPACSGADYRRVVRLAPFRIVGPVWADLERYEQAWGQPIKDARHLARLEREQGLVRQDWDSPAVRAAFADQEDEAATYERIEREDGLQGLFDYQDRTEICDQTGWSTTEYRQWEAATDAADSAVQTGAVAVPDAPAA